MTTPISPPISMADVLVELQGANPARTYPIALTDADVRQLAGIPSGEIELLDLLNKSAGGSPPGAIVDIYPAQCGAIAGVNPHCEFRRDGTQRFSTGTGEFLNTKWVTPWSTTVGDAYWLKGVFQSGNGSMTGDTLGVWLSLSANRNFDMIAAPEATVHTVVITFSIATSASDASIVESQNISYVQQGGSGGG